MRVDLGNALETTPGLTTETLDRLDDRVAAAHERIATGMADDEFGYAALTLPETADPDAIYAAVDGFDRPEAVLTVGIGGSALGAATLSNALASDVDAYVLDNVDPDDARRLLADLPLDDTVVNVVSKSGTTAETLANFLVVREAMADAGVDWTERTLVTTGETGNLRELADRHDLPSLPVPDGVPGRFSALSTVGLAVAALQGHDVEAVLAGGRDGMDALAGSLYESPAYAYGAATYALADRGALTNAVMPYAESLETFAEWFAQLWAESLGKDGLGQTPARALGATDQHSQLQLYRAGPPDKLVTLVRPTERADAPIPETDLDGLAYLGGSSLGDLLDAEFEATEASLAAAGVPNVRVEVDRVDERALGELLFGMEAACVLYGELASVSTFTQPAVEWGKKAARGLLGGGDFAEAEAVDEKRELRIE
ncbi:MULTISPECIES: glucose-6-phosphate isomerase [unclassified Halorubrum]|uniref:glucose-6-phosphate isomerase n=1 Tax=unclassified Halorubrum TaxID=2642239 RepID=UPI0010F9F8B1|nr:MULTISPECIES: glucose-6-phosphate isomerase [unclassified Halorubrum]TKX45335.1 glucose-6-phosphate isomerase [Halorubrum sp. ARQ200]TKX51491.1 glucose-6-phosphate isomerase [Halorubrum sp. ASP121]